MTSTSRATGTPEEHAVFAEFCDATDLVQSDFRFLDAPDFVRPDMSLGVELVSYHRDLHESSSRSSGSARRAREARLDQLLSQAKDCISARGLPRVDVYVFPDRGDSGRIPQGLVGDLVDLVARGAAETPADNLPGSLRDVLSHVMVAPTPDYQTESIWQAVVADYLEVEESAVQAILDAKELLLPAYRARVRSIWLLVHGSRRPSVGLPGHGRWSTHGQLTRAVLEHPFRSSFDGVYYLDRDLGRCDRLRIIRNTQAV
ncbi:hypothetical protein [Sorangium sp. So ce590]|uniref:hypothetical protein n=1 Tax=unclassified Sorangium TaxID=2621164 RepID=UPI003F616C73